MTELKSDSPRLPSCIVPALAALVDRLDKHTAKPDRDARGVDPSASSKLVFIPPMWRRSETPFGMGTSCA